MLVLTRKIGEMIRIGDEIELVVVDVARGRVKLGFAGPRSVSIRRGELADISGEPVLVGSASNANVPSEPALRPIAAAMAIPFPGRPLRFYRAELSKASTQG